GEHGAHHRRVPPQLLHEHRRHHRDIDSVHVQDNYAQEQEGDNVEPLRPPLDPDCNRRLGLHSHHCLLSGRPSTLCLRSRQARCGAAPSSPFCQLVSTVRFDKSVVSDVQYAPPDCRPSSPASGLLTSSSPEPSPCTEKVGARVLKGGKNMSTLTLPKGKTAILVMDCQNDIVHEQGKVGGSLNQGVMHSLIKVIYLIGTISMTAVAVW